MDGTAVELTIDGGADAVPLVRRRIASELRLVDAGTAVADAELVAAELVTNAILHGTPPVRLRVERTATGARVEVRDAARALPVLVRETADGMTGRGLALVNALASSWGVDLTDDGGKVVWAELRDEHGAGATDRHGDVDVPAGVTPPPESAVDERRWAVHLGEVPTQLLVEASAHVDNLVREFALATTAAGAPGGAELAPRVARLVDAVTHEFADARAEIKGQALAAAGRGDRVTTLDLTLAASAADEGERYLAALDEADRFARSARLLTLEASPVHQVFRRWCVGALVDQVRHLAAGRLPARSPSFEERLAEEYAAVAPLRETAVRMALVQAVTADLAAAASVEDVADTLVADAVDILDADVAAVYLLGDDGMLRSVRRTASGDEDLARRYDEYPADADLPGSIALRTGEPLVFSSRADLTARFPHLAGSYPDEMTLLVAPLVVGDHKLGVLALRFRGASAVDETTQRTMMSTLAGVTAQALERAVATTAARDAADKLAFLADASVVLSRSLDHRAVLQAVADLVVPRLADWCVIQLLDGGRLVTVALTHFDPAKTAWARSLQDRYPTDMAAPTGAPNVIRTGRAELYPWLPDELLQRAAVDLEHLRLIRGLGISSALVVPLTGRSRPIGAISLISAESRRRYGPADVALAEDLARRAALAVETADAFRAQSGRLADVIRVAEAVQHAILADPPRRVGSVALAARYVSAAAEALIGGDLYEVATRPSGVRLLIGDVRGKGLDAVRIATIVLGEFRAAAADGDDIGEVARQIDRRLRPFLEDEDFVTAVIADIDDSGAYTIANCGHPTPLLTSDGVTTPIECPPSLPLGLGVDPVLVTGTLVPGDRLLLYTDGLVEARDASRRFVDPAIALAPLGSAPLDHVLDEVLATLRAATGGHLSDDLALLVAEFAGPEIESSPSGRRSSDLATPAQRAAERASAVARGRVSGC